MTWTYSGDPSSSTLDEVRFLIGDTDTNDQLLSDEEITYLIGVNADQGTGYHNYLAASSACNAIAAKYAKMSDKTVGSLSIRYSQKHSQYLALAQDLLKKATTGVNARKPGAPVLGGGGETYLGGNWS